ncbi:toll-like receptor 5 isoform X2 [Pleurodeles waltl]|uniref:toll-like receptor 5 isoform X2 n=1 Tax=Pleurodeles waltl TaxID=8319 RepID=UPI0037094365
MPCSLVLTRNAMSRPFTVVLGVALLVNSTQEYSSCTTTNRIAWFQFCNLTHVPPVPEDTLKFLLSFNYILEVNATSFPLLEKLIALELGTQHTSRLTVRKDAFKNLPNLHMLDLGDNKMLLLDPDAFTGLFKLTDLLLYHNNLDGSVLENDYFRDLVSLELVDLSGNSITHLKPNPLFYYLHNFSILSLKLNRVGTVCEGDLHSFQRKTFEFLDLSDNYMYQSVNMDWDKCGNPFRNIKFERLVLSSNGFSVNKMHHFCKAIKGTSFKYLKMAHHTMGAGFGYQNLKDPGNETFVGLAESDLKFLDISNGFIFSLNPYVFANLTQLETLMVTYNKVNVIQRNAFYGLNSLHTLNLTENLLGEIYDFTFNGLPNVANIELEKNHIGIIQEGAFKHLKKLNNLNLRDNALKTIALWAKMPFIEYILLGENRVTELHVKVINSSFIDLSGNRLKDLGILYGLLSSNTTFIKYIIMKHNYLSHCHKEVPMQNNQLEYLDLSSNALEIIWSSGECLDVFTALSMLQVLHLDNNYLRFLPKDIFFGITSLTRLNLSSNSLTYLPHNIFPDGLGILDLSKNQLVSPDPDLFTSLSQLDITNNRFVCDCSLSRLIVWLNHTNVTMTGSRNDILCVFPSTMIEVPLHMIITDDCDQENLEDLMFSLFVFTSVTLMVFMISVIIYTHLRGYTFRLYRSIVSIIMNDQRQEVDDGSACRYDAYLCYSSKDFEWVQNALLKNLDSQYCEKNRFNVCFEERDFIPGEDHIINIRDAIWNSRKTICIVTKHFLRDGWCVEAFNFAQSRYYTELKDVLIVVVAGALSQYQLVKFGPIRSFVQRQQYLRWPEDLQDIDWFFNRLSKKILKGQLVEKKIKSMSKETNTLELQSIATVS